MDVNAAARATYVAFIGSGFAIASWVSRIPQIRDRLELNSAQLGFVILAIAVGSVLALPLAGHLVSRFGSRNVVSVMSLTLLAGLGGAATSYLVGVIPLVVALFVFGFANGAWDVAMNVQGAQVEQRLGRAIMPRFHAAFSLGTVAGALIGVAMVVLEVPVTAHLCAVAVLTGVTVCFSVQKFFPDADEQQSESRNSFAAWSEGRTLLIGLFVLAFAFAEGSAADWLGVSMIDDHHTSAALATFGYAVFVISMTTVRWMAPSLLARFGRVALLRALGVICVAGLALFVLAPNTPLALLGVLSWGFGTALGFPVGMSAAADEPDFAPARVSVVASIAYCAFLAGPPLIGFIGHETSVLRALTIIAVLVALVTPMAGALREPKTALRVSEP